MKPAANGFILQIKPVFEFYIFELNASSQQQQALSLPKVNEIVFLCISDVNANLAFSNA
jgi:hypothetical protein